MPVEKLNCPNCGAPLEVISGITRCPYCSSAIHFHLDETNQAPMISLFTSHLSEDRAGDIDPASKPLSEVEARKMAGQIGSLCLEGQRTAAIKMYRERTGEGFLSSKQAVEQLAADPSSPDLVEKLRLGKPLEESKKQLTAEYITEYVRGLVEEGYKFDAVRWYGDIMGVTPIEAKRAVEAIMGKESFR